MFVQSQLQIQTYTIHAQDALIYLLVCNTYNNVFESYCYDATKVKTHTANLTYLNATSTNLMHIYQTAYRI